MPLDATAPETDGRRLRTAASRRRIIEALIALVYEGEVFPPAEAVAARAQVGLRTVFRLFKDKEGLYRELHGVLFARLQPYFPDPVPDAPWRTRLVSQVERRTRAYEEIMPVKVASDAHRARSPFLQGEHEKIVGVLRAMLLDVLPPAVAEDADLVEALDAVLSFEAWRRLRLDQKLSSDRARQVTARTAEALLAGR